MMADLTQVIAIGIKFEKLRGCCCAKAGVHSSTINPTSQLRMDPSLNALAFCRDRVNLQHLLHSLTARWRRLWAVGRCQVDVRYSLESRHSRTLLSCPLYAKSRHRPAYSIN